MHIYKNTPSHESLTQLFPIELLAALHRVEAKRGEVLYISGGTVRDVLLGRTPADVDISVASGAEECCRMLIEELRGGVYVKLGTEEEEAARVVWHDSTIDFSSFRKGAQTIEEELHYRDFTINSLAIQLAQSDAEQPLCVVDPLNGRVDLAEGVLRCSPAAFADDPLRMLRGYRLQAELGFFMSSDTILQIHRHCSKIAESAAERTLYELDRIMSTASAAAVFRDMAETGLLWQIIPELKAGVGVEQPGYHHEDVFNHCILALASIDEVIASPQRFFGATYSSVAAFVSDTNHCRLLRWAALFHDLGKPATCSSGTMQGDRVTFHDHDRVGRQIFQEIAERLRMSRLATAMIGKFVDMHMHPFHLSNVRRISSLSRKALLKICKKAGDELPGLFVLAMADSLAGQGELKPVDMEEQLSHLFDEIQSTNEEYIKPVLQGERLINGHDLINSFGLIPGPHFREIFDALEVARIEGAVLNREEAVHWLEGYLQKRK